jgi:hypothetical protein
MFLTQGPQKTRSAQLPKDNEKRHAIKRDVFLSIFQDKIEGTKQ